MRVCVRARALSCPPSPQQIHACSLFISPNNSHASPHTQRRKRKEKVFNELTSKPAIPMHARTHARTHPAARTNRLPGIPRIDLEVNAISLRNSAELVQDPSGNSRNRGEKSVHARTRPRETNRLPRSPVISLPTLAKLDGVTSFAAMVRALRPPVQPPTQRLLPVRAGGSRGAHWNTRERERERGRGGGGGGKGGGATAI